jgi:hypothetical protein
MRRWLSGLVLVAASLVVYGRSPSREQAAVGEPDLARRLATGVQTAPAATSFVRVGDEMWLSPALLHALSLLNRIAPSPGVTSRVAAIAFGTADVLLVYLIGLQLFNRERVAVASALILLFTPAHAAFSRVALPEGIWPLPFVLIWLLTLRSLIEAPNTRSRWIVAAGTGSLILAGYVQPSAVITISTLAAVALAIACVRSDWTPSDGIPAVLTAALLFPALVWWSWSAGPDGVSFARWLFERADVRAGQVASAVLNRFWSFFLPSHLFLTPGNRGFCGLLLTASSVPIAFGAYALLPHVWEHSAALRAILVAGCIAGPLTAALCGPPFADGRALITVPFAALIAGCGSALAWEWPVSRAVVIVAFAGMAIQAWLCV